VINRLRAQGLRRPVRVSSHRTPEPQRLSTIPCRSAVDRLRPFVMVELRIRRSVRVYFDVEALMIPTSREGCGWKQSIGTNHLHNPSPLPSSVVRVCDAAPPGHRRPRNFMRSPVAPVSAVMVRLIVSKLQTIGHGEAYVGQRCSAAGEVVCLQHGRARAG
jgi:uncharacterized membrane protein